MNRLIVVMLSVVFMIVMTGCTGMIDRIPKDNVMVKKITKEETVNEIEYEGVLSQVAIKTLSLNAVKTYLDENITMEDIQYELLLIDQSSLKDFLIETENGRVPEGELSAVLPQVMRKYEAYLEPIVNGLYFVTITKQSDPREVYKIVLNAKEGDVLQVIKLEIVTSNLSYDEVDQDKVNEIANAFIEKKGDYSLSDLSKRDEFTRWTNKVMLYYDSIDSNELKYIVEVNVRDQKVVGFSKDVMAFLVYYNACCVWR
ncbi:hypothetical protein [Paenibacillus sp. L3-i20]|uniref:hypothetical protein n=1 Tax=Paenibacillus sp. L3-i20 TaxID=2905833 RepID=UPI001EDD952E|nr:hypothetical protein [Paenibacillus sp. L3-i20]GKU77353.1 hypothetical protein L3i20_v217500 [Paenibacillus sp. L3-i20]